MTSVSTALTKTLLSVSRQVKQSEAPIPLAVKHEGCLLVSLISTGNLVVAST